MIAPYLHNQVIVVPLIQTFVSINAGFVGGRETGVNDGEFVKWIQKQTGNSPPAPWCSSMQAKAGYMLLRDLWPVPLSASCKAVGDWAEKRKCLHETPAVGALYLFWHEKDSRGPRFAHIACCEVVKSPKLVETIEGNTSEAKSVVREGVGCFRKSGNEARAVQPKDRFVYWWEALQL